MNIGLKTAVQIRRMAETNLVFSKVVATPTPTAWSQAYSAGRLFAAFSLESDIIPEAGEEHLNSLGKDLISTLESEFFTLEKKDLESIKQALGTTVEKVREGITLSMVLCFLSENVLYLFANGGGKAVLKRGEKIGTVLEADESQNIKLASGYVQEDDIIILQTKSFQKVIPASILASSLDHNNPNDIAENLAPHLHEKPEGAASSVILLYKEGGGQNTAAPPAEIQEKDNEDNQILEEIERSQKPIPVDDVDDIDNEIKIPQQTEETPPNDETEELPTETTSPFLTDQLPRRKRVSFGLSLGFMKRIPSPLSHQRRIITTIAAILIVLIVVSAFLALRGRQDGADKQLFADVISQAQEKYDEGQNLKDLNGPLAQESFRSAKQILEENKDTFREGSSEDKQIEELLSKVNKEVSEATQGQNAPAKEVEKSESDLLSYEIDNPKATFFAENEDFVYFTDGSGVTQIDKGNDEKEQIIKKDWKTDGGIGLFGSNVYVLDKENGVLKFVAASESAYNKTNYFSGDVPDFGNVSAMAIDGSVYVLFDDGDIKKYTRGNEDSLSVSGVEKAMSNPTRIFTSEDTDNIYVLDNGNSRIVVLDKSGKFVSSYSASVIKSAKDFDVDEVNNKIFILSGDKVYQIDLR